MIDITEIIYVILNYHVIIDIFKVQLKLCVYVLCFSYLVLFIFIYSYIFFLFRSDAMKKIQKLMRQKNLEQALGLLRTAR